MATNFTLTGVFFFCTVLKFIVLTEAVDAFLTPTQRSAFAVDLITIEMCLFLSIVFALILASVFAVQSIVEAARVPTFRLVATGNRPEMPLEEGHRWHLFLSHSAAPRLSTHAEPPSHPFGQLPLTARCASPLPQ